MKKYAVITLFTLFCASCIARTDIPQPQPQPQSGVEFSDEPMSAVDLDMSQVYTYTPSAEVVTEPQDDNFYRRNIIVKASGDNYVVYEYVDVRIDKVATLASRYCYDTNPGKSAYLRDLYLNRNHKRRATFECIDLASE